MRAATIAARPLLVSPRIEDPVRALLASSTSRHARQELPDLGGEAGRGDAQVDVRRAHAQLLEEDVAQQRIVVLAGVDQAVRAEPIEQRDDAAQPDDLRARPDDRDDLHRATLTR